LPRRNGQQAGQFGVGGEVMATRRVDFLERAKEVAAMTDRLTLLQYLLLFLFIGLGVRFWSLQVVQHEQYRRAAENNRIRLIPIPAPRGAILDRHGRVIVDNRPTLSIILNREEVRARGKKPQELVEELIAQGLELDRESVRQRLEAMAAQPAYYPLVLKENATPQDVAWVRARQVEYPELDVMEQPQRRYPYGTLLAHVLGYVGEISREQLARPEFQGYRPGDLIGRAGVERVYDRWLRGRDGYRRVIVDSTGHEVGEIEHVDPVPGRDIKLTIDLELQQVAEEQLGGRRGAIVVVNPQNGEILALASHPAYDPALFSQRINTPEGRAEYRRLLADPERPLYNRAIQGVYPTGSTWKIFVATAALEEGLITPEHSTLPCGRGIQVGNRFVRCLGSHGMPDLHRAIVVSCDGYFYRLGLKLGIDRMERWVKRFGLGQRTGIDLPDEVAGIVPSRALKAKLNPRDPRWKDFDTVIASIGQGSVAISPLQLVRAIGGIAVGGVFHTPHVFKEVVGPGGMVYTADRPLVVPLHRQTIAAIRSAMWGVVNEGGGTGGAARVEGLDVSGKTGTAQVVAKERAVGAAHLKDHAWFVSFAPRDNPQIAVVVLIENVGFGGRFSAPVARAIYEKYKETYVRAGEVAAISRSASEGPARGGSPPNAPSPVAVGTGRRRWSPDIHRAN
jgi:penicillin-binding protein 2